MTTVRCTHRTPAPPARRRRRRCVRGLTLLELLIVIGILVLVTGVAVSELGNLSSVKLRSETNKLAAAIRHAFNRAAAHGLYMRMVFDLDAEAYWVEASATPVFLPKEKRDEDEDPDRPLDEEAAEGDEGAKSIRQQYQEDGVIPRVQLSKGLEIHGVLTSGQSDVFRTGKAYLHFFPDGRVEPAIIYTSDEDDASYTLIVHPFTGRVTRKAGRVDPPREFGRPDKVEEESW